MKLFILGATGGIGRHLLQLALERGHHVTAYVRSPQKIESTHARLNVVQGDVFNPDQLARSMAGHDAVLDFQVVGADVVDSQLALQIAAEIDGARTTTGGSLTPRQPAV